MAQSYRYRLKGAAISLLFLLLVLCGVCVAELAWGKGFVPVLITSGLVIVGVLLTAFQTVLQVFDKEQIVEWLFHVNVRQPQRQPRQPFSWKRFFVALLCGVVGSIIIAFITYAVFLYPFYRSRACDAPYGFIAFGNVSHELLTHNSIYAARKQPGGECVGLSDGQVAFDLNRQSGDATDKIAAASAFGSGDLDSARSAWTGAINKDGTDAENLIYQEDQRVLDSDRPYIDVVVVTMLTEKQDASYVDIGRDNLQGFYLAQLRYNRHYLLSDNMQVRFILANVGEDSQYAEVVAQQIEQVALTDSHFAGVVGWPFSSNPGVISAIKELGKDSIPIISPTASADDLTWISSYFFRLVPANKFQGIWGAKFAENDLHATRVALFVPNDRPGVVSPYGLSLANDFKRQFEERDHNTIVVTEHYTGGQQSSLAGLVQDALKYKPDLIYFPGYSTDAAILLDDLANAGSTVRVLGGDALYHVRDYPYTGYPPSAKDRLYFTTFADPSTLCSASSQSASEFCQEYTQAFGTTSWNVDVMLSYDAAKTLFEAVRRIGRSQVTTDDIWQQLRMIDEGNSVQGINGPITFAGGDPVDDSLVVLYANQNNKIQLAKQYS